MCVRTRASPWEFRKKRTKPCRGETHTVKFQAQVLGQKPTLLFRPYRACHCFTAQTQGIARAFTERPIGAGKAWFVARPRPFELEARHTAGTFSKLTRRAMT